MFETATTEMMETFKPNKTVFRAHKIALPFNLFLTIRWIDGVYYRNVFGKNLISLFGFTFEFSH